jgi:hypothetical protein
MASELCPDLPCPAIRPHLCDNLMCAPRNTSCTNADGCSNSSGVKCLKGQCSMDCAAVGGNAVVEPVEDSTCLTALWDGTFSSLLFSLSLPLTNATFASNRDYPERKHPLL